eukprot:SAG11_NODE_16200_length_554_cov_2.323077_1_plen_81_part_10
MNLKKNGRTRSKIFWRGGYLYQTGHAGYPVPAVGPNFVDLKNYRKLRMYPAEQALDALPEESRSHIRHSNLHATLADRGRA